MIKAPKRKRGRPVSVTDKKASRMPGKAFQSWLVSSGLTDSMAARQLGTSPSTIARYRKEGGPALLALACSALSSGLSAWTK